MRLMLSLMGASLIATPAVATDWWLVGTASTRSNLSLVDRDSITDMGENMRRADTYQVFAVDNADGSAAYQPLLEFDCTNPRYRFVTIKSIAPNGRVTKDEQGSGRWRPILSGSIDEANQQFVCSGGAKPSGAIRFGDTGTLIARGRARLGGGAPAPAATARNWVYVGMTDSASTAYFIDRNSIRNGADGSVAATAYSVHSDDSPSDGTASAVLDLEFDCTTPRYRFKHLTGYTAKLTQSYDEVGSGTWRTVGNGSLDDAARTYVCARGQGTAINTSYGSALPFAAGRARLGVH